MNAKVQIRSGLGCRIRPSNSFGYKHRFGGDAEYKGTMPAHQDHRVHLLIVFDLEDPLMPVLIEGVRFLPLFFAFQYDARPMTYRVVANDEIEILEFEGTTFTPDFPYSGYPASFEEVPLELIPISYEEQRALLIHNFVFDNFLDPALIAPADMSLVTHIGFETSRIGDVHALIQKDTQPGCSQSTCENYGVVLRTFATLFNEPIPGVDLWRSDGEPIQIVFQICPMCSTIRTFTLCT